MTTFEYGTRVSTPLGFGAVRNVVRHAGVVTNVLVELDVDTEQQPLWRAFVVDDLIASAAVGYSAVTGSADASRRLVAPGEPVRPPKASR